MTAFDKTFELANLLNNEPLGSSRYVTPSEVKFNWTNKTWYNFKKNLEELKTLLKYSEEGNSIEPYETLIAAKYESEEKARGQTLEELNDSIYSDLFYYSDRWCFFRMARIIGQVEELNNKLKEKV